MAKWADYLISEVRFNSAGTHIDKVRVHTDTGEEVSGTTEDMTRQTVIDYLDSGKTFVTIYKNDDGSWKKGASVGIVTIKGTRYIKTHSDGTEKDNLDELPPF
ncbi:MAG TPA: DUF3892 domain-containing protein [Candidatus Saccharimonadales bacterium]|nr:DUF3892 domain-containing protein [Candidatus Saccharimonadales bacterium]